MHKPHDRATAIPNQIHPRHITHHGLASVTLAKVSHVSF